MLRTLSFYLKIQMRTVINRKGPNVVFERKGEKTPTDIDCDSANQVRNIVPYSAMED